MTHPRRHVLAQLAGLTLGALPWATRAQTGGRPIRLLVGYTPGGPNDILARIIAPKLAESLKQTVVVENKPGAAGNLASTEVARAPGDGLTLLLGSAGPNAISPAVYPNFPFDPVKDIAPVSMVAQVPSVLAVRANLEVKSVADLVKLARAQPGRLTFASSGSGSTLHLAGELYSREYGAQMVHVPFSNPGNATTNLISGEIQLMFQLIPGIASQVKAGRVRAIGVMAAQRSPALPDVPTMVELGAPKLMSSTWFALLAPKGTPAVALERMNAAMNEVLADPAVKKRLSDIGASPLGGTPKQLADHLAAEIDKWGRVVRDAKISVQ
jgi:tripartite-type tricarboxylate transporter receptor subunit TctC